MRFPYLFSFVMSRLLCLSLSFFLVCGLLEAADFEVSVSTTYFSRYLSEGRDDLEEGGLIGTEVAAAWHGFSAYTFWADALADEFGEFEAGVAYTRALGPVEVTVGCGLTDDLYGEPDDREIAVEVAGELPGGFVGAASWTNSFLEDGSAIELFLARPVELADGALVLEPSLLQIFDFGLASPDYDGPSNLEVALLTAWWVHERIAIVGSVHHSFAQEDVERDGGGDLSWFTVGVSASL